MNFLKGLKKKIKGGDCSIPGNTAQLSTMESENKVLYPSPNTRTNISGSDKFAAATPVLQPPKEPIRGLNSGIKPMAVSARVTPDMGSYGAPKGTSGVTGISNSQPFQHSYGKFGRRPRQAIKSITRLRRGL